MNIVYGPIEEVWGKGSFIEDDYKGYLEENGVNYEGNKHFAGLILYDEDDKKSVKAFVELAAGSKATFIVVEYCNCSNQELINYTHELLKGLPDYFDMQSYETKDSFCLKAKEN